MTILTDEIVEKAMRAASISVGEKPYKFDKFKKENPSQYQEMAGVFRAVFESVLPEILDEAAKVAEECPLQRSASHWRSSIAARIRNLKPKEEGNG